MGRPSVIEALKQQVNDDEALVRVCDFIRLLRFWRL